MSVLGIVSWETHLRQRQRWCIGWWTLGFGLRRTLHIKLKVHDFTQVNLLSVTKTQSKPTLETLKAHVMETFQEREFCGSSHLLKVASLSRGRIPRVKLDPPQLDLLVPGAPAVLLELVWSLRMNTLLSHVPKIRVENFINETV